MVIVAAGVVGLTAAAYRSLTTTTVVLVRHAEKELGSIDNPPLAPEGEQRAERLAQMLGEVSSIGRLDAIYVSEARRTQQTAAPLATRLHLQPVTLPAENIDATARHLLHDHRGGAVLIVGHSNTLPQLIHRLADIAAPTMTEQDYDDIYIVTVPTLGRSSVLRLKY